MDSRFKNIESELNFKFSKEYLEDAFNALDNYELDQAFIDASSAEKANYSSAYWNSFIANEASIVQDLNFSEAAANYQTSYDKSYWFEAEKALINEGLHFEYKPEYWNEAEKLLSREDRKVFFFRWSAIASILLLFGLIGQGLVTNESPSIVNHTPIDEPTMFVDKIYSRTGSIFDYSKFSVLNPVVSNNSTTSGIANNHSINSPSNLSSIPSNNPNSIIAQPVNDIVDLPHEINPIEQPNQNATPTRIIENIDAIDIPHSALSIARPTPVSLAQMMVPIDNFEPRNGYYIGLYAQTGYGNSVNSEIALGARNAVGVEFAIVPKNLRFLSIGIASGFTHERLRGFEVGENFSRYDISGSVDHSWYRYTYDAIVKLNAGVNAGFKLNDKNKLNLILGYEKYLTSKIKLEEYFDDFLKEQPVQWGVNNVFNQNNFNLGLGYERLLNPQFSLTIESRVGLWSKVNSTYLSGLSNNRDITALIGLKYKIFRY